MQVRRTDDNLIPFLTTWTDTEAYVHGKIPISFNFWAVIKIKNG